MELMKYRGNALLLITTVLLVANGLLPKVTDGLQIFGNEEGPCMMPNPQQNIDFEWIKSVPKWYFSAGSRYQYYHCASGSPFFYYAREFEFYYGLCLTAVLNFNTVPMTMNAYAWGGSAGTYTFTIPSPGVFDLIPQEPIPFAGQHLIAVTTLTDNASYVFTYKCWTNVNQRGWELFTTHPEISPELQKRIEDHAVSLGFDRSQFEFLRYDFCGEERYRDNCHNSTGDYYNESYDNIDYFADVNKSAFYGYGYDVIQP